MRDMKERAVIYSCVGRFVAREDIWVPGIEMGVEMQDSDFTEMRMYRPQGRKSNRVISS